MGVVVRLVFFLLAIANAFLVWRHFDELMLIGSHAEAQESVEKAEVAKLPPVKASSLLQNSVEPNPKASDETMLANARSDDSPATHPQELASRNDTLLEPQVADGSSSKVVDAQLAVDVPRQCYWAGPLNADESAGAALMERLRALRIGVSDHRVRTSGAERFWVIIPGKTLKRGAASAVAELKKAKIDSYEIGRGEHAGAVSLGFYSQESLANARVEKAARLGWSSKIVHVASSKHQQWLQVDKLQADAVGEGILARMVKNNSGVEIIEKKCELPVASHNNIL